MRTNLKHFLARLALIALILLGANFRLSAHDLPADRSLTETATANCFTSSPEVAVPSAAIHSARYPAESIQLAASKARGWSQQTLLHLALRQTSPALAALTEQPKFWSQLGQKTATLSNMWSRAQYSLDSLSVLPKSLLVIASPDVGAAPRPNATVRAARMAKVQPEMASGVDLTSVLSKSLLAIASPDVGVAPRPNTKAHAASMAKAQLAMADGVDSTSVMPKSLLAIASPDVGAAPRPNTNARAASMAKAQPAMAGEVYMPYDFRMSDWRFGQFPYHGKTATALPPSRLPSFEPSTVATIDQRLPALPASRSNDLLGPQFVVYGSTFGGHIVLTLAQAREWKFEMPLAQANLTDQSRWMELLVEGLNPIQSSARATASTGFHHAVQTLLNMSQSLWNISAPRVASGPQIDQF